MSGTYPVVMGDRGRLVVPAELRERLDLRPGSPLLLVETPDGIVVATRDPYANPAPVTAEGVRRLLDDAFHGRRPEPSV